MRGADVPDAEGADAGVTGNSLWPATIIESLASENFELGNKSQWRKATILADAVMQLMVRGWVAGRVARCFVRPLDPSPF